MSNPFRVLTLDELFALDLPELEWQVEGICPAEALGLLTAREKAGKGLIAVDLLASVASEEPFLDRAVKSCPVAYFAAEEHLRDVRDRVRSWFGASRAPFLIVPLNTLLEKDGEIERLKIEDPASLERLSDTISAHNLGLIVIDTLREIHDGPENDSDFMGPLLRPLRTMAHQLKVTIIVNHHHNKNNTSRGSTAIKAAVDFEWSFTRTDTDDDTNPPVGRIVTDGRWQKQVIHCRFGKDGRWELATPTIVMDDSARSHILTILKNCKQWRTAAELTVAMTNPKRNLKTVQNALSKMVNEQPCPLAYQPRDGQGGAREYHCLAPTFTVADPSHDSQEDGKDAWEDEGDTPNLDSHASQEPRGSGWEGINQNGHQPDCEADDLQRQANEAQLEKLMAKWAGEVRS